MRRNRLAWLLGLAVLIFVPPLLFLLWLAVDVPARSIPLGRETTYFTGPFDAEGYVDYEAALNDALSEGITPETNANVLIWQAIGPRPEGTKVLPEYFQRLGIEEPPEQGDYFISLEDFLSRHRQLYPIELSEILEHRASVSSWPWKADDYPHVAAWLKANERPLALVVEASQRPHYFNPLLSGSKPACLLGVLLPSVQKCRGLAFALTARALLRVSEGEVEAAWQDLLACHRLARLIGRGGTLIEALVGMAIEQMTCSADLALLREAKLSNEQIRRCLNDLQALPSLPPLADKIGVGERSMWLNSLQLIQRGYLAYLQNPVSSQPPGKPSWLERRMTAKIDWAPALRRGNEWYDRLAASLSIDDRAHRTQQLEAIDSELKTRMQEIRGQVPLSQVYLILGGSRKTVGIMIGEILVGLLTPAVLKAQTAHDKAEQMQRNVRLAFALAVYESEHGRYPEHLNQLVPEYLTALPKDLFSDKPMIYRPKEDGYLLYSVGPNGEDEGGRGPEDDPRGDDLTVRMPLPRPDLDQ